MRVLWLFIITLFTVPVLAQELPMPRFAALRSDTVYMRAGPGERFPIEWVYKRKNLPVQIIDSFEHWYKIEDVDKTQGWIHKKMLTGRRTALTSADKKTILYKKPRIESKPLAYFEGESIVLLLKCEPDELFCQVKYNDLKGYIIKDYLFGVYPNEEID